MFHFYNTCLIFLLFSDGIIISSTGSCFSILTLFDLATASEILFPKYSPALWTIFWKHLIFYRVIVFYIFSQMIKSISSNIYSCFWFYRISHLFYLLISNVKLTLSSISNGQTFWSVNAIIHSTNSVLYVFKNTKLLGSAFNKRFVRCKSV